MATRTGESDMLFSEAEGTAPECQASVCVDFGIPSRSPTQLIKNGLEALASFGLASSAYLGPVVLLLVYDVLQAEFHVERPTPDRTVEYMASMSLIPFPDSTEEVREVTDELLQPPGPTEGDAPDEDADEGTETPLEQTTDDSKAQPVQKGQRQITEEVVDGIKTGGKNEGPTQDGDGDEAQDCLPDNPKIKKVGKDKYRVPKELVDHYANNLKEAERLATTYWQLGKEGDVIGFRVRRIRCGNDLYQMGFRGGDVVIAVNDEPVATTPQIVKAYFNVRKKNRLTIKIRRNRQERTLIYVLY